MNKVKVLILEDEREWVAKHKFWLEEAGFECKYTYDGRDAVDLAIQDYSLKVAIIDEILLEKDEDGMTVTQPLQGGDVRDKIREKRDDIYFIIISSKPEKEIAKWQEDPLRAFREASTIEKNIRQEKNVVNFYHKYNFENPKKIEEEYHFLIKDVREILEIKPAQKGITNLEFPSLYIGLGVKAEVLVELLNLEGQKKIPRFKRIRDFIRNISNNNSDNITYQEITIDRQVRQLYQQLKQPKQQMIIEKKLYWIEANGTWSKAKEIKVKGKKSIRPAIKSGTRSFEILEWLAWQVEFRDEPTINAEQYLYDICGMKRPATGEGKQAVEQYRREQGQTGVQIETLSSEDRKRLTVEISRLCTTLVEANIGFQDKQQIFRCDEGSTSYTALFKTGVLFYPFR